MNITTTLAFDTELYHTATSTMEIYRLLLGLEATLEEGLE
jgi:hypothetical protein